MKNGTEKKKTTVKVKVFSKKKTTPSKSRTKKDNLPNLSAPILITTSDFSMVQANDELAKLFESTVNNITRRFFDSGKFFDSANKKMSLKDFPFAQALATGKSVTDFQIKYVFDKDRTSWFRVNSFFLDSAKSKSKTVSSIFTDITRDADVNNIFHETVSSINTVLYSTNSTGTEYNFITEAVRSLFGFSPEEIYENKTKILRLIYPEYFVEFRKFILKVRKGEEAAIEYKMQDRFGKEHWVRHTGVPIFKNAEVYRVVGVIQDITDEKLVQLKLTRSEEQFRMLIDTADDLIFILNGFGYFSMVNKNGASALGYMPDEIIGRHFLEFIDKEDEAKVAEAFTKILSSSGITIFEAYFLDRFDKSVLFEIHAKPLLTDGEISGMLSIGRNITGRKKDEQKIKDLNAKLIEANRIISIERERARNKITVLEELNKLKSEFISNVSHELRTPLASIVGFAETIYSDQDLGKETLKEFSNIILNEGKRLGKLINDLLDFSKLEAGEEEIHKQPYDIIDILDKVSLSFEDQMKEKNITLTKEYPQKEQIVNVDRERIKKVFANILSNAIKFTTADGRISILVQEFGKEIEVDITDTGVGIPEKEMSNLFQKFGKVNRPGTQITGAGFGLVSAKQIIDLHRGFIKVRSEENKGTTFIIRLPK
jgi:two-component system, sporulation sensor kinase E